MSMRRLFVSVAYKVYSRVSECFVWGGLRQFSAKGMEADDSFELQGFEQLKLWFHHPPQ